MNKLKVAYFVKTLDTPSETFVRSLVKHLSEKCDLKVFENKTKKITRNTFNRAIAKACQVKAVFLQNSNPLNAGFDSATKELKRGLTRQLVEIDQFKPDFFYADFGRMGLVVAEEAIRRRRPIIIHFHGNDASEQLKCQNYVRQLRITLKNPLVSVIVPSDHLGRMLQIACGSDLCYSKIPYGPEINHLDRKELSNGRTRRLLSVGRLVAKKNPLALIESFRVAVEVEENLILDLIGDGPLMADVEERIQQLNLSDKIVLHGRKPHTFCMELMSRADLYIQHSVTDYNGDQEGLPNAILEALLLKTPVVSTLHSGIPEVIDDGRNGYLVREHDFVEMGKKIVEALRRDRDSWTFDRLSEYTPEIRAQSVLNLISEQNIRN